MRLQSVDRHAVAVQVLRIDRITCRLESPTLKALGSAAQGCPFRRSTLGFAAQPLAGLNRLPPIIGCTVAALRTACRLDILRTARDAGRDDGQISPHAPNGDDGVTFLLGSRRN